ncbi:MAG: hypothetical protein NT040_05550 [Bacteroidetes bacterium]|nr:hypothetical protein [Bacteroidota bacterium]
MKRKNKRLLIFSLVFLLSAVVLALGLKYFPFTKVVKMPAVSESEFVNPEKAHNLSPHTLYYDFEVAAGKEMPGGFYKGLAHSGQYSVKAFGQNSFSVVVERTAGEVGVENLRAVALSAWIYVFPTKTNVKGSLVFTASNEVGVNVFWQGVGLSDPEVPRGKWFKISTYFDLSKITFKPSYKLQVYFWNNSGTDILIDDYFISFGGAVDRRGDSARVDMTKPEGFIPKFNYPPFPVSVLEKESLGRNINPADIDPEDHAIAGNFLATGNDALLVVSKAGKPAIYAYCQGSREFRKLSLNNPAILASLGAVKKIVKGKFIPGQTEQFIVMAEKGWMLGALAPPANLCSNDGALQTSLKLLSKSDAPAASIFAGDFNGDGRSEILGVAGNGTWKVMSFETDGKTGGTWKVMASDESNPVKEWDRSLQEAGISAGHFLQGVACDVLLTVTRSKSDGKYAYSLRKLNLSQAAWDNLTGNKQNHFGKTIGLDTLKPEDTFFAIPAHGNKTAVFRYNRDWRYDLKEIQFSDTAFTIVSAVDFHGYDKDQNPKYYESLKLVTGCFLNASPGSVLAMGRVAKSRHYQSVLPDFVHLYSFPVNK